MATNKKDVKKIMDEFTKAVLRSDIAAFKDKIIDIRQSYIPAYDSSDEDSNTEIEDDEEDGYEDIPSINQTYEQDQNLREMNFMWDDDQADQMWEDYQRGEFQQRDADRNFKAVQQEFEQKSHKSEMDYIYLDFTQNLTSGSRNRNDIYQESIEEQFEKIRMKLMLYGRNDISDLSEFVSICFPMIKSTYYVSLPSFVRHVERSESYRGADCIYNMVLRPQKSGLVVSIIPKELDVILVGDLVFRNELISFVVKGLDLIDENVEKFGELPIECAAACAITRNNRNLPDYGIVGRDLYKSFLTRDIVLSLCEKVYPIEHPEKAIEVFEKWTKYIEFRKYFLMVQSRRNECMERVTFQKAYAVSVQDYRKNEDIYAEHLLDGNKNFIKKDQVLLDETDEDAVEFPLIKVEIIRNLAEINKCMTKNKKISNYERELRRFTRVQVALSKNNLGAGDNFEITDGLIYLGERVAFETEDVEPECDDIIDCYDHKLLQREKQIDEEYREKIQDLVNDYREKEDVKLEDECVQAISTYFDSLDRNFESDIENNTDKNIEKRFNSKVKEIKAKYEKQRKKVDKKYKNNKKGKEEAEHEEEYRSKLEALDIAQTQEIEEIPLRQWYVERNNKLKEAFKNREISQKSEKLKRLCTKKEQDLQIEIAETINNMKREFRNKNENDKQEEIRKKKERLTERHFYVYFKAEDIDFEYLNSEMISLYRYLVYDNRAEKAKIERQRKTLDSFYRGYVKNPFLASYLFVPETLGKAESEFGEIDWYGSRLNDSQKEAVRKALASNSLFLIQGPPGTGKTEVIAEITAQYVKQGKKVLVSSETHKAIDNVFDRLPKIPEIRPLRLIPSQSNKDTEYSPEKLVDNLYQSISSHLDKRIRQYENFTEMKNSFGEKMKELRFRHSELLELERVCHAVQIEKKNLQSKVGRIDSLAEEKRGAKRHLEEEFAQYNGVLSCIDRGSFAKEVEKADILARIGTLLFEILSKYDLFYDLDSEKIAKIYRLDLDQVRDEFKIIEDNSSSMSVEQEKASIKSKIRALRDPDTDDIIEGKEEEYDQLRKQLIALKDAKDSENKIDYFSFSFASVISADQLESSASRAMVLQKFIDIKAEMNECINKEKNAVDKTILQLSEKISTINHEISELKNSKTSILIQIEELNEDDTYSEYRRKQQELKKEIVDFFVEFEIHDEYPANDYAMAIELIGRRWDDIKRNQEELKKENQSKIPMYKAIRDYLADEEILEEDRISYTKKLFDNANVFGMTCTSREYFKESSMKVLREYNLGDINMKNEGIDVVIIDEVSKSSFLDLMIPILYGKTVILVGDHRQLPPLYDLKHMKKGDFDGLDSEIIDYDINKKYQKLYETCFFKELFEKVPSAYKIMLDKQYRCHSDIMDVFNHFYSTNGKGLAVGLSNQNDLKQHSLMIKRNGITLIEPQNHIYFVNCTEYESRLDSESSSIVNRQEAEVTCQLLKMMNEEYGRMLEDGKLQHNSKKDDRKSIGVICTYRDQARFIKNNLKGQKFKNYSQKREDRLIINTVDDFQGDERDIIIVSMVRNPRGDRYSTDFIDQFERINVALSRARCMLIVVGAQEFLSRSSINLPDINGNKDLDRHSFPVYREIIRTIQAKGKVLQASDIIGEVKHNGK